VSATKTTKRRRYWDEAKKIPVIRSNPPDYPLEDLEPGVKLFVLILEKLGCVTTFSCEGHPDGFYICFRTRWSDMASLINDAGFFTIAVDGSGNQFRLSLDGNMLAIYREGRKPTLKDRNRILRCAGEAWVDRLGLPDALKEKAE
jgi:hypothetical protein